MIASFIKLLELPNFVPMTLSTVKLKSLDIFCDVMDINYDVIIFISNTFILKSPRVANLADIIKIAITFFKPTLKDSKEVMFVCNLCFYFFVCITITPDFR